MSTGGIPFGDVLRPPGKFSLRNFQQHTVELGHRRAVLCLVRSTHLFAAVEGKARQRFWSQMVEWDELMLLTVGLHFATQRQFPSCHLEDSRVYFEHKGVGGKSF